MGGMGGVGLVLVNPGGRSIDPRDGGSPTEGHEIGGATRYIKRVVRFEGHVDGALAALADEVEAMVEELTKDRHPAAVGW